MGADSADPGVFTKLNDFESAVVVNGLRRISEVDQEFCISIRQKTIEGMHWAEPFEVDHRVDELIERKRRLMRLKNHGLETIENVPFIIEHIF